MSGNALHQQTPKQQVMNQGQGLQPGAKDNGGRNGAGDQHCCDIMGQGPTAPGRLKCGPEPSAREGGESPREMKWAGWDKAPGWLGIFWRIGAHRANMHIRLSCENVKSFTRAVVFDVYCGFVAFPRPVTEGGLFGFFNMTIGSLYFLRSD